MNARRSTIGLLLGALAALLTCGRAIAAGPRLVSATVTPAFFSARALVQKQFQAIGTYDDGSQKDLTAKVKWSSADPTVAAIVGGTPRGVVLTLDSGATQIIATASSGKSGSSDVAVGAYLVALQASPTTAKIRGGTGRLLGAVGTFSDGTKAPLRKQLLWSSSDNTIVSVGPDGWVVGANKLGSATITATQPSGAPESAISATAQVTVSSLLSHFKLSPNTVRVRVRKSAQLKAIGTYSDGANRIDITKFVDFQSSDPKIAVAANKPKKHGVGLGQVTGVSPGTAQVTAKSAPTGIAGDNSATVQVR